MKKKMYNQKLKMYARRHESYTSDIHYTVVDYMDKISFMRLWYANDVYSHSVHAVRNSSNKTEYTGVRFFKEPNGSVIAKVDDADMEVYLHEEKINQEK